MSSNQASRGRAASNGWLVWKVAGKALAAILCAVTVLLLTGSQAGASEGDLAIPDLHEGTFTSLGGISAWWLLFWGACVIAGTLSISLYLRAEIHKIPCPQFDAQRG